MAFPTSGLSDNQVHKEGNRSFIYDSTLLVWDQAPEAPDTISIVGGGTGLDNVELGSTVVFPTGHVIQVVTDDYAMQTGTSISAVGTSGLATAAEQSTKIRFSIIPKSAGSKIIVRYQSLGAHVNNRVSYYAIGHEVTASDGTATASTMLSQLLTVNAVSDAQSWFRYGEISNYSYHAIVLEAPHSPSYTVGQKIWYSIFGYANDAGWFYFADTDVRFKAMEIKG